jgi:hypothetical protein
MVTHARTTKEKQMARPQPLSVEHQIQLHELHSEITLIKDNHLVHLGQSVEDLKTELKDTKDSFDKRFDRLDERLWLVIGLVVTTLVGIVVSGLM